MNSKKAATFIIVLVIIVAAVLALKNYQKSSSPYSPKPANSILTAPIPSPVSKPAPVQITTARGIISSLSGSNLVASISGQPVTYSLSGTKDFQRVTSGTVEKGDAKTAPSTLSDLKVGQEVLIITPISSTQARSVYIIK